MEERKITHHTGWEVWKIYVNTETGSGYDAETIWEQMSLDEQHNHSSWSEEFDSYCSAVNYLQDDIDNMDLFVFGYQENNKQTYLHNGVAIWYVEWGTYDDRTVAYDNWKLVYCQFGWAEDYK